MLSDALQFPGLVTHAMKAVHDRRLRVEFELVLDLCRVNDAIAERARRAVARAGPPVAGRLAWQSAIADASACLDPECALVEMHAVRHGDYVASVMPGADS